MPDNFRPNLMATGIGSLPFIDPGLASGTVLERLTEMPYWPQLPKRDPAEDMNLMYAPALSPLLAADRGERAVLAHPGISREEALAGLYERLFSGDLESFKLTPEIATGFFAYLEKIAAAPDGAFPWLKGHVTGPLTLAASVTGQDGKTLLYDDEAAEAIARGLGVSAAAQLEQMAHLGRPVMLFFDEPFLTGYGSSFTPISRERVMELLGFSLEEMRSRGQAVAGVHCCGNTEWSMLIEAGFDVINLDSAGYGQGLLLYPEAVKTLMERGGAVAWGAVPAFDFKGDETAEGLWQGLKGLLEQLEQKGIAKELLASQSLVTPACGLGTLSEEFATRILDLTKQVSDLARAEY